MIKKAKIIAQYRVNMYCDRCGKGMERSDVVLPTYPPTYNYECECGWSTTSNMLYPYINIEFDEGTAEIVEQ